MARKSVADRKKDAKRRVRGINNPLKGTNLANKPARIAFLVLEGAKLGAEILIDRDPANLFTPDTFGNTGGGGSFDRPEQSRRFISADEALAQYRNDQRGAQSVSESIRIPTVTALVVLDPMVIQIKPKAN